MKKIILGMLIILTSLSFSNNLDKYESKRIFDKYIEIILTGKLNKYKNDPEMTTFYKKIVRYCEGEIDNCDGGGWTEYFKNNEYEVINVKEGRKKSILTVKVTFNNFDYIQEEILEEYRKFDEGILTEIEVLDNLMKKSKRETKVIKVGMKKEDGYWSFDNSFEGNNDLSRTLDPYFDADLDHRDAHL